MKYKNSIKIKQELDLPKEMGAIIQALPGKPYVILVQQYQKFEIPKDRDSLIKILTECKKVVYEEDVVTIGPEETRENYLVRSMIELRSQLIRQNNLQQADKVTDILRNVGVVADYSPAGGASTIFWNTAGETGAKTS